MKTRLHYIYEQKVGTIFVEPVHDGVPTHEITVMRNGLLGVYLRGRKRTALRRRAAGMFKFYRRQQFKTETEGL